MKNLSLIGAIFLFSLLLTFASVQATPIPPVKNPEDVELVKMIGDNIKRIAKAPNLVVQGEIYHYPGGERP